LRSLLIDELSELPVHDTDEIWDVALLELPVMVSGGDGPSQQLAMAICASSSGAIAASDPTSLHAPDPECLLDAIRKLSLQPHHSGSEPIRYLPACVRLAVDDDASTRLAEGVLRQIGVSVQRTDELVLFLAAADALQGLLGESGSPPPEMPALMSVKNMTLAAVRGIAEAMALFCDAAPWRTLSTEVPWQILPAPRTRGLRACVVTGALGEQIGLAFLSSIQEFEVMHLTMKATGAPYLPASTIWSVMAQPLHDVPAADVELWKREGLPMCALGADDPANGGRVRSAPPTAPPAGSPRPARGAKPGSNAVPAIPEPMGITTSLRPLRPTPSQLLLMETLLRGFAAADRADLRRDAIQISVETSGGPKRLLLRR
jgi:hypothetical protein